MHVSEKIDWLSVTFPAETPLSKIIPPFIGKNVDRVRSPIPVYDVAYQHMTTGMKILKGNARLGTHVIMSGSVLDNLREHEVSMQEIWNIITNGQGKVSRIDLTVDVQDNENFLPKHVQDMYFAGLCETKIKHNKHIGEDDKTQTFYIGRMNSKTRRFRVYDKVAESGLVDKVWTRIEYDKRRNAHKTAIAHFGAGQSISSIIKSVVDFPEWQLWQEIFDAPKGKIPRSEPKESDWVNTLNWLTNSAAKAIKNAMIAEYRDKLEDFDVISSEVLNTFAASLSAEIRTAQLKGELPHSGHEHDE